MGRIIGQKHKKQASTLNDVTCCPDCGQLIHPRFKHHCWRVKEIKTDEWDAFGRGAFRVIEYV